jgi:hypothetical protein
MNINLDYEILPGFVYNGYVSMKLKTIKNRQFLPQEATGVTMDNVYANQSTDAYPDNLSIQSENKLLYRQNWDQKHNLVLAALWYTDVAEESSYTSLISGVASPGLTDPVTGGTLSAGSINSGDSKARTLGGILNANYTLLDRYTFSANINDEGRSSLGKANRWGLFPTAGFAWHVESEPFMEGTKSWLDELKLRVSIGESGNAPTGTAPYIGTYTSLGLYIDNPAIAPKSIQLNNLKRETKREIDPGFDASFFKGNLKTTLDYYYSYTDDLLQKSVYVPSTIGYNNQGNKIAYYNSGAISNQGVEFRIDYNVFKNEDWNITANFNISRNINKIEKLPDNLSKTTFTVANGSYAQKIVAGTPGG